MSCNMCRRVNLKKPLSFRSQRIILFFQLYNEFTLLHKYQCDTLLTVTNGDALQLSMYRRVLSSRHTFVLDSIFHASLLRDFDVTLLNVNTEVPTASLSSVF